jgi:hypothetical protein
MLVKIRLDMDDLPVGSTAQPERKMLQPAFDRSMTLARREVQRDLKRDIWSLVAGELAADISQRITLRVLRQLALRAGVSGSVVGAGVGSSWSTFGISLAGSIAVDWAVFELVDWWANPEGELAAAIRDELDQQQRLLLDGGAARKGLRAELQSLARRGSAARRKAILAAMSGTEE